MVDSVGVGGSAAEVSRGSVVLGLEEVVGVLRSSGLFVRSEDILAIDRVSSDTYRIIIARNGVAGEVYITRRDGRWFRTPLKLHETVKFVDLGVKLVR